MQDQWFYTGWVPPQRYSREGLVTPAPCIVLLANGQVAPHGQDMLLAAALSIARFGSPPSPPPNRPDAARPVPKTRTGKPIPNPWNMAALFSRWYRLGGDGSDLAVMGCPICLEKMSRLAATGGSPSDTAPKGKRWTTVDHIIHIEHEECYWCVWPFCNECNSSKGKRELRDWLAGRITAPAGGLQQLRDHVRRVRKQLIAAAPHGHAKPHDCASPATQRKSYGCAIGQHDFEFVGGWQQSPNAIHVLQKVKQFRCRRAHCEQITRPQPTSTHYCEKCGRSPSVTPQCWKGNCRTPAY